MLTRALAAAALVIASLMALSPLPAQADTIVTCTGAASLLSGCSSATVTVVVTIGGQQVEVSLSGGSATVVCHTTWGVAPGGAPAVVPCDSSAGWWSGAHQCYVREMSPQPPSSDPVWQGQTSGKVYNCTLPPGVAGPTLPFWAQDPPVSSAQVVNLAARAVQSLGLVAIDIGMAPTPTSIDPASIGVVGLPNWMWVKNPLPRTYGPAVGSASDGVVTVTVTAKVDRVTWTMGDGSAPIICTTAGTPYAASYGASSSPDCGREPGYQHPGTYNVEAASHWTISYTSSVGIGGSLSMSLSGTSSLTVGEYQSLAG
jgi:hypothetical protein